MPHQGAGNERSPERRVPTIDEVYDIAEQLQPRYKVLVLTAAFTGLRWGELMALRQRDLDLRKGVVHVRASLTEVAGELLERAPKSAAGKRSIAIPKAIMPELKEHLASWAQKGAAGHVFVTSTGTTPKRSSFGTMWRRVVRADQRTAGLHFHDLRHCANDMAANVVRNLREQMRFMGHSSTDAALRYQHQADTMTFDVAAGISKRIEESKARRSEGHAAGTERKSSDEEPNDAEQ